MRRWIFLMTIAVVAFIQVAARSQTVFRSGVQYVAVDVVVTDKDDKPVTDLRRDEFEITEGGKKQTINEFQLVSLPLPDRTVETSAGAAIEAEPDVSTNIPPSPNSRLFVVVIDDLHLIEQDIVRIKSTMRDLVQNFLPDDEVALVFVSFSDKSVNFTRNHSRILAAVDAVRGSLGFGLDSLAQDPTGARARYRANYARSSAATLKSVTLSLAGSSHPRRAIFYITAGTTVNIFSPALPPEEFPVRDDTLETFDLARRADVPIYTIDPRGNVAPEEAIRGGIGRIPSDSVRAAIRANLRIQRNNLSEIAINTGGRAIVGASDMKRMMQEVVQENSSFYLLGYYPDPAPTDGKFHDLKVTVSRPGVIVRARKGYVAPSATRSTETTAQVLEKAMSSGVNVSGLPIRVAANPIATGAKGMLTAVTAEVTYPAPLDGSRRIDDNLELNIVALDADAKVKMKASRPMKFSGTAPSSGDITFLIDEALELPSQSLVLRVGVASQALGKAGTSQISLDVPKPGDSKLQMSGVAIGFDGPPRAAVMNASLIAQLLPFQPTTTRTFVPSDTLKLFARLFWKGKDQPTVTITQTGGASPISTTPAVTVKPLDGRNEAELNTVWPLKSSAPGRYHLSVDARLPNGQHTSRVVTFEVK